jgi:hypothetical protein
VAALTVLCGAAAACSNISLSSGFASGAAEPPSGLAEVDAGGGGGVNLSTSDAGAPGAPAIVGNPLCNRWVAIDAGTRCDPDDPNHDDAGGQCALPVTDAGHPLDAAYLPGPESDGGGVDGNAGLGDDGGANGASDAGAATPAPTDAGTPVPACHVSPPGADSYQWCAMAGAGKDGDECTASTDCASGYECVGSPGQCRHYCCGGNAVCSVTYAPSFCNPELVAGGAYRVPVCMPISGCTLFGTCPSGQTCGVVKDDGTTSCVPIGPQGVGAPCDSDDCAAGLTCLGMVGARVCYQLCHVSGASECPSGTTCTGSAQLFGDPQFGICR